MIPISAFVPDSLILTPVHQPPIQDLSNCPLARRIFDELYWQNMALGPGFRPEYSGKWSNPLGSGRFLVSDLRMCLTADQLAGSVQVGPRAGLDDIR